MGDLLGFSSSSDVNKWHELPLKVKSKIYSGISLAFYRKNYPKERFWELPSTCTISKEYRISLAAAKEKIQALWGTHRTVFGYFSDKIALKRQLLRLKDYYCIENFQDKKTDNCPMRWTRQSNRWKQLFAEISLCIKRPEMLLSYDCVLTYCYVIMDREIIFEKV